MNDGNIIIIVVVIVCILGFYILIKEWGEEREEKRKMKKYKNRQKQKMKRAQTEQEEGKNYPTMNSTQRKKIEKEKEKKVEPNLTEKEGKTYPIMNSTQRKKEANLTEEEKRILDEKRRIAGEKEKKLLREIKAQDDFLKVKEANKIRKEEEEEKKKYEEEKKKNEEAVLFLERKKILPLRPPVDKTGDKKRYLDFIEECGNKELTNKYLYLVRIKSNIDDKKFIKIGVTSNENINERFEDDEVIDLIEVIRSEKLETKLAMAIEYSLIQKHRPQDYLAEEEFDVFSRFDGYTEVIPMRYTKEISKDIDSCIDYSENILSAFKEISRIS